MNSIRSLTYRSGKRRAIIFQVQQGVVDELDRLGKVYGTSRATLLREAVFQFLDHEMPVSIKAEEITSNSNKYKGL